ncbi:MAG: hypothetical protein LUD51_03895 [Clostridia bacterium]|nr:hypothetical protein [Clostridia bacterium]
MDREYNVSLDLGSDTVKIACAFLDSSGKETVLKVVDPRYSEIAIPAVACYDAERDRWLFGYEVGRNSEKSYATVVKIKDLLNINALNPAFYTSVNKFPLFVFPITNTIPASYYANYAGGSAEAKKYGKWFFSAGETTPRGVCEQFFAYVVNIIAGFFKRLFKAEYDTALKVNYTLIVKPQENDAFVDELKRLFMEAVKERRGRGLRSVKVQTSAKVLGMLAAYYDSLGVNGTESALLFDIGEERISVVKFTKHTKDGVSSFSIDGVSGHSLPRKLGGNDIDKAVVEDIERDILGMESVGTGAEGSQDYLHETGSRANNYLFMKSVKAAKVILGREYGLDETDYPDGVPVSVIRDVDIYRNITQESFARSIGTRPDGRSRFPASVADRIADYIISEIKEYKGADGNVRKVYLTGGAAGTAGLADYVQAAISSVDSTKKVRTFARCFKPSGRDTAYSVKDTDIFSYGPSVGAALVSLRKDRIVVCLTKSYGRCAGLLEERNEASFNYPRTVHFTIWANMGSVLDFENGTTQNPSGRSHERYVKDSSGNVLYKEYWQTYTLHVNETDMYVYSANITDSCYFPEDSSIPEDIQKAYRSGAGKVPVRYFVHYEAAGRYWLKDVKSFREVPYGEMTYLATPLRDGSNGPITEQALDTLHDEFGFTLEGRETGTTTCMYYRNRRCRVTRIYSIVDKGDSSDNNNYHVDEGVRIDKDGYAVTFARMHEVLPGDSDLNRGKLFDIEYINEYGNRCRACDVPAEDLIVDLTNPMKIDTGNAANR